MPTQLTAAQQGTTTPEVSSIAAKEHIKSELLRDLVAHGKVVIPANTEHLKHNLEPMGIGKGLCTKVNANIGASAQEARLEKELKKLEHCIQFGADTVMDLSTEGDLNTFRSEIVKQSVIPVGTVPIYQVVKEKGLYGFDQNDILNIVELQAKQGVDYMTIHAGFKKDFIPATKKRVTGVVSRGGGILGKWMEYHGKENPFFEAYDEICNIFQKYDVTFSLGDSLRPGGLVDCNDEAQISELKVLGDLTKKAWNQGVQVMIEGPGHVPIHMIEEQMKLEKKLCHGAPFYVLGPLTIDTGAGYDHITGAIGGAVAAMHGADMLCYVTPAEHLRLPDADDVKQGLIAFKIAAKSGDVAKKVPGVWEEQAEMSKYRKALNWKEQRDRSFDPKKFMEYRGAYAGRACGMCGDDFCPMNEKVNPENAFKMADEKPRAPKKVKRLSFEEEQQYV